MNWVMMNSAVGQSLHYAKMTREKPGILLIVEGSKDKKYLTRLKNLIEYHQLSIKIWTTKQSDLE